MKIWNVLKRFKLKVIGLFFIFIMITPALLPTISLSINQAIKSQQSNNFEIFTIISSISTIHSKNTKNINSKNPLSTCSRAQYQGYDLGITEALIEPYIHGFALGAIFGMGEVWIEEEYSGVQAIPRDFGIWTDDGSGSITIQSLICFPTGCLPIKTVDTFDLFDDSKNNDFEHIGWGASGSIFGVIKHGVHFPAILFAYEPKFKQDLEGGEQIVTTLNTSIPFKLIFTIENASSGSQTFTGTYSVTQKIGEDVPEYIAQDIDITGTGIAEINIDLSSETIGDNTELTYNILINSPKFRQNLSTEIMANIEETANPFITSLRIDWEDWYDQGIINYAEPFDVIVRVFNPKSSIFVDDVLIWEQVGGHDVYYLTEPAIRVSLQPGYNDIRVTSILEYDEWPWFDLSGVKETSAILKISARLEESLTPDMSIYSTAQIPSLKVKYVESMVDMMTVTNLLWLERKSNQDIIFGLTVAIGVLGGIGAVAAWAGGPYGQAVAAICGLIIGILTAIAGYYAWDDANVDLTQKFLAAFAVELRSMGADPLNFDYYNITQVEFTNVTFPENMSQEFQSFIGYISLLNNLTAYMNAILPTFEKYQGACLAQDIIAKQLQANVLKDYVFISNQYYKNLLEIQEETLGTKYLWNSYQSEISKNGTTHEQFLTNLSFIENEVKENGTSQEVIDELHAQNYTDEEIDIGIEFITNLTTNFEQIFIYEELMASEYVKVTNDTLEDINDTIINLNLAADEIVDLSDSITISNISVERNEEATKNAEIGIMPSTLSIIPGQTEELIIRITNRLSTAEHYTIDIQNVPSSWDIDYQEELFLPGLTTTDIPVIISIPKSYTESPRSVPISIEIKNTEVDFQSDLLINVLRYHEIELSTSPDIIEIEPRHTDSYLLVLRNLGNVQDTFDISLKEAVPSSLFSLEERQITLQPGETRIIDLNITINIDYQIKNNLTYNLNIMAVSSDQVTAQSSDLKLTIIIYRFLESSITPAKQEIVPGETAIYSIYLENLGNIFDTFLIDLEGEIPNTLIEFEIDEITLVSNEDVTINLYITVSDNWKCMDDTDYEFILHVFSLDGVIENNHEFALRVTATPKSMILYTISEIEMLREEINSSIDAYIKDIMIFRLDKAEDYLQDSLTEYKEGSTTKAVILDKLAKSNIEITEIVTWIGDYLDLIEDGFVQHVIGSLHSIRDHITLIMGKITGTPVAMDIAKIEIEISRIADSVYDYQSVSMIDAILINVNLWQSTQYLDCAIIKLADNKPDLATCYIQMAVCTLKQTKIVVSFLNWIGSINDIEAQEIKNTIQIQINNLNELEI
ncbi:MAG: COG1470 family protein [Candidatus Helarchaeota archaeon]